MMRVQWQGYWDSTDTMHRGSQLQSMVHAFMKLGLYILGFLQLMQLLDTRNVFPAVLFELCSAFHTPRMQFADNAGIFAPIGFQTSQTVLSLGDRGVHGWQRHMLCKLHGQGVRHLWHHLGRAWHHLDRAWHHFGRAWHHLSGAWHHLGGK